MLSLISDSLDSEFDSDWEDKCFPISFRCFTLNAMMPWAIDDNNAARANLTATRTTTCLFKNR